jgi:hypothetical protein
LIQGTGTAWNSKHGHETHLKKYLLAWDQGKSVTIRHWIYIVKPFVYQFNVASKVEHVIKIWSL